MALVEEDTLKKILERVAASDICAPSLLESFLNSTSKWSERLQEYGLMESAVDSGSKTQQLSEKTENHAPGPRCSGMPQRVSRLDLCRSSDTPPSNSCEQLSIAPDSAPVEPNSIDDNEHFDEVFTKLRSRRNCLTGKIDVDSDNLLALVYKTEHPEDALIWVPLDEVKTLANRVERCWRA